MKQYLLFMLALTSVLLAHAQNPGIPYQATLLAPETQLPGANSGLIPLKNTDVCLRFTFKSASGTEYQETQTATTSAFGRIDLVIGNGTPLSGSFAGINWDGNPKTMEVDIDYKGLCANFEPLAINEFQYVPYAFFALNAGGGSTTPPTITATANPTIPGDLTIGTNNLLINVDDADSDPTNEIELPLTAAINQVLTWDGSTWVAKNNPVDADSDPTNEIQDLTSVLTQNNNAGGLAITNLLDPTNSQDAATKAYVDALETSDIAASTDKNYVTDAELTVLQNTSGTNTGDQTLTGLGGVAANADITAATKTKITYDAKGLVTAGADATTADIAASTDKNYVTDAELTVLQNTSGTNTGDQTLTGLGGVAANADITAATKTKITYDAKGLVTAGADATTADIAASTDKNYVTDAELTVLQNTSGTNTGDQTLTGLGGVAANADITAATKTKITYDAKGLVTAGADATTADIAASTDKNYVTDAELTVLQNTSGTNTGDQTLTGLGGVAANADITAATKTKITYDAKGLVTAGADATTADIAASTDKNYVTDAELTVLQNTSGTNTGDQTLTGLGGVAANADITAATKTKITYDAKGLVTAGADATTADIAASTDKNYVTDAELTVLQNTSGTNTGDQTLTGLGGVAANADITAATKTKITYDAKGLVTAGADATTADIAASTDKNYVTDAELTVLQNTSGTNTGDQTLTGLGGVAANADITAATKTKITYDAKGLVTAGADATTADIAASTDKNYVTDAELTVLQNTSGTNTGDQTLQSLGIYQGVISITLSGATATFIDLTSINASLNGIITDGSTVIFTSNQDSYGIRSVVKRKSPGSAIYNRLEVFFYETVTGTINLSYIIIP